MPRPSDQLPDSEPVITLMTRAGCHLCIHAQAIVQHVATSAGVSWCELDVDSDPGLAYEYGDRVPVVLLKGKEHGFWCIEEQRLLEAIKRLRG